MYRRILVAIDGSAPSDKALATALALAKEQRADLRVAHVADVLPPASISAAYYSFTDYRRSARAAARDVVRSAESHVRDAGVRTTSVLLETLTHDVSGEIVSEAKRWRADLIVIGSHGRSGLARLVLGSVAEGVTRKASTAVLIVRESPRVSRGRSKR